MGLRATSGRAACAANVTTLSLMGATTADVFDMGPGFTSIQFVPVGNPGNGGEWPGGNQSGSYGSVPDQCKGGTWHDSASLSGRRA